MLNIHQNIIVTSYKGYWKKKKKQAAMMGPKHRRHHHPMALENSVNIEGKYIKNLIYICRVLTLF